MFGVMQHIVFFFRKKFAFNFRRSRRGYFLRVERPCFRLPPLPPLLEQNFGMSSNFTTHVKKGKKKEDEIIRPDDS